MKQSYKAIIIACLTIIVFSCYSQSGITLREANLAYDQLNAEKAFGYYQQLWEDQSTNLIDRATAGIALAKMTWLIYDQPQKAMNLLAEVEELSGKANRIFNLYARIALKEKDFEMAVSMVQKALETSTTEPGKMTSTLALAEAILGKYRHKIFIDHATRIKVVDAKDLEETYNLVLELFKTQSTKIAVAKALLGLALLKEEHSIAFKAWCAYYRLKSPEEASNKLKEPYQILESTLNHSDEKMSETVATDLILGLAKSGFVEWAIMLKNYYASEFEFDNREINDLEALYHTYLSIEVITENFYRATALGKENRKEFGKQLNKEAEKLWMKLHWKEEAPKFTSEKFDAEVRKRFGTVIRVYNNTYMGLHLGQAIKDEIIEVEQYGRKAKMQYVKVDHMISNGYLTWFADGRLSHGGWINSAESIFQVRLSHLADNAWERVHDPIARSERLKQIEERKASDLEVVKKNPYNYLFGLLSAIRFKATDAIYQELLKEGLEGEALEITFKEKVDKYHDYGTIIHEARHAIDKEIKDFKEPEFEFRAKLSEIYFSEVPFFTLAYGGILSPDTGGKSAHGKANLKILKGLVEWMEEHQNDISGFDRQKPVLPQLELLTEEQLKAAMKSMDPLAQK